MCMLQYVFWMNETEAKPRSSSYKKTYYNLLITWLLCLQIKKLIAKMEIFLFPEELSSALTKPPCLEVLFLSSPSIVSEKQLINGGENFFFAFRHSQIAVFCFCHGIRGISSWIPRRSLLSLLLKRTPHKRTLLGLMHVYALAQPCYK